MVIRFFFPPGESLSKESFRIHPHRALTLLPQSGVWLIPAPFYDTMTSADWGSNPVLFDNQPSSQYLLPGTRRSLRSSSRSSKVHGRDQFFSFRQSCQSGLLGGRLGDRSLSCPRMLQLLRTSPTITVGVGFSARRSTVRYKIPFPATNGMP